MMLSAVAETFENCKLRKKSDVNETYITYAALKIKFVLVPVN